MKHLTFTLIFLTFSVYGKTPRWVTDPASLCKKSELCAVGEGASQAQAKRAARLAIGKIFKTQVKAKYAETISSVNGGNTDEEMSEEIEENTDVTLEGVDIKKIHESDVGYYALASLNKRKAAATVKKKIDAIDNKLKTYASDSKASSWMKLEPLFQERENLNARYTFLSGFDMASPVTYAEIFKLKTKAAEKMRVYISLKERKPKQLEPLLVKVLSDRGYKTLSRGAEKNQGTHFVEGEYSYEKQYLKVDGFEKYKFLLSVVAKNQKMVESGALTTTVVTTGRSFEQAQEAALPQLHDYLIENIEKLNIE